MYTSFSAGLKSQKDCQNILAIKGVGLANTPKEYSPLRDSSQSMRSLGMLHLKACSLTSGRYKALKPLPGEKSRLANRCLEVFQNDF